MRVRLLLAVLGLGFLSASAQSLQFNGSNNYVNLGNGSALHLQNFTLEAWINIQGSGTAAGTQQGGENGGFKGSTVVPLITKGSKEKGTTTMGINYFFGYQSSDRKLIADFEDNSTGAHHTVVGNTSLTLNKWTHVAVSYNTTTNTWTLYINGSVDKTTSVSGSAIPQSTSNVAVAVATSLTSTGSTQGFFNGMVDEVRIWNVVRTSSEISTSYNTELTSGTGLVGRYGFNENSGTTAANSVVNNTTGSGKLVNNPQWTLGFNQTAPTNNAPVLNAIGNKTVTAGQTLIFTTTASDPDAGQTLTYSLIGAPSGAAINATTGAFSWTPSTASSYTFTVRVSDNGSPVLYDDEQITVVVSPSNQPPVLNPIGNQTATTGQALTFTASATDPDVGQTLTYSLVGAPSGGTINASTGAFSWTPTVAGSYTLTVQVSDNGSPVMSASEQITVTVNDIPPVNHAPVLNPIGNQTVIVGQTLTFTASATDPDAGQTLTYSLIGAPNGASINASTGAFSWTPASTGTFSFTVRVSDNGSPVLTDDKPISVTVNPATINQALAIRFNGSNSYVYLGNDASLSLQSFTLEAWIKQMGTGMATSTGSGGITAIPIITKGRAEADAPSNVNMNYFLGIDANNMLVADFEEASGPNHPVISTAAISNNVWTHVAVTYEPVSAVWKLYVNGALVTTKDVGSNIIPASVSIQPAAIGSALNSTGVADGYFNGVIDEVRIWNVVRSATEISGSYNAELTSGSGLAARYGFNEGSGISAGNSIGSISGQLINSPAWTTGFNANGAPVLATIGDKTVIVGQALTFTAKATDPDAGQTLTFSLVSAPSGASIDASSGAFSWTPASTGTYAFSVQVSDNGSPIMTDAEQITVTVNQSSTSNTAPNAPANPSPADLGSSSNNSTSLCITATDPDNNPLRVRFYGRKKVTKEKFTVVFVPDTQFYTAEPQGKNGGNNFMYKSQTKWIANNRTTKNIQFVGGLGDCVEKGDTYEVEWKRADTAVRTMEDSNMTGLAQGLPYILSVGNHDQSANGDPNGTTTLYNKYFGASRFNGKTFYGGHSGANNDNHYALFSASGIDFLVISPEYDQTSGFATSGGTLDWMESVVNTYPNRKVIVTSHFVLDTTSLFSTQGAAIYNRLKVYPNFILMVGGHAVGNGEARRSDTYNGHVVNTTLQNYQARQNGGNGLLRTYEFDPQTNTIAVKTYSPYTNTYETDFDSQFSMNVDLNVTPDAYSLIGEVNNVTSGSNVCANWPALLDNTTYEWYAEVWDGKTTTTGPVWSFKTKSVINVITNSIGSSDEPLALISEGQAINSKENFTIYPNPNSIKHLTLSLPKEVKGPVSVEIVDLTGKVQFRKDYTNVSSTLSIAHQLAHGTYMVVVKSGTFNRTKKLVVIE